MTVKGIPLSPPMVRASLDGRKTQTRRIAHRDPHMWCTYGSDDYRASIRRGWYMDERDGIYYVSKPAPSQKVKPGDLLYGREAWRTEARFDSLPPRLVPSTALRSYEADFEQEPNDGCRGRYRHARFMPRVFSRLTYEVNAVKVERLQDISEEDAMAEGVIFNAELPTSVHQYCIPIGNGEVVSGWSARECYRDFWDYLNAPIAPWRSNPFVVAISANVHAQNVDALLDARGVQ